MPVAQRGSEPGEVARLPDPKQHAEVLRGHVAGPPHGRGEAALSDDRTVDAELHAEVVARATEDRDVVCDGAVLLPAAIPEVLAGMRGVLLLLIEEGLLVLGGGEAPCYVVVVVDEDDGGSRDA